MNLQPKVSVVVPIYNVEQYLPQCVDSLLSQTLQEMEIVLVDDGSPDGCPELCDRYAAQDSRVKVVHKPNGGLISARIAGVNAATAPYVGFVDADDFAAPHMFETLYRAASENEADLVCCSFYSYWNSGKTEPLYGRFLLVFSKENVWRRSFIPFGLKTAKHIGVA